MVKKYTMDESLPWEERYYLLESHHIEETKEMAIRIVNLKENVLELKEELELEKRSKEKYFKFYNANCLE